jgi:hypothetical protein
MTITVREMTDSEFDIVIEYFFKSTPEFLETLGVACPLGNRAVNLPRRSFILSSHAALVYD